MELRLCVPAIHRLVARNWNFASSGLPLTASSVANRVGVSTPLSGGRILLAVVIAISQAAAGPRPVRGKVTSGGDGTTLGGTPSLGLPSAFPGRSCPGRARLVAVRKLTPIHPPRLLARIRWGVAVVM